MINKQTGQNANQTEVEQAITKVQTTLQALNGDHNLQVAKTNATQAIDALTSLNDPQNSIKRPSYCCNISNCSSSN